MREQLRTPTSRHSLKTMAAASSRWAEALHAWAIPREILAKAPESPWGFPPELFAAPEVPASTPSRKRALGALPPGGSVLDVGVGAGAASLGLVPPAARLVGVDESADMLVRFTAASARLGIAVRTVRTRWPEAAGEAGRADVVVCHHVLYNVADLVPFVRALTSSARRRVVVELTAEHPQAALSPLWLHFHGLERPTGPSADDAVEVLEEVGIQPDVERFTGSSRLAEVHRRDLVAFARRRLCLPADRDPEVDSLLPVNAALPGRELVCLWWSPPRA
jgi:SAM-dependent methyltransferase